MAQESIIAYFEQFVPPNLERGIISAVQQGYFDAAEAVGSLHPDSGRDLMGHERRAHIETALLRLAGNFEGVRAVSRLNAQQSYAHTYIEVGNVRLTASKVDKCYLLPRKAVFRAGYARSAQLSLFEEDDPIPPSALLYGIIVHCPDVTQRDVPAFINIAFPSVDGKEILATLPLYDRHPDLVPRVQEAAPVEVTDQTVPLQVRKDRSQRDAAS